MIEVEMTAVFSKWLSKLRDDKGKNLIISRIQRLKLGHLGDGKSIGGGVIEMRIDSGPGYRIYFTRRGTFYLSVELSATSSQTSTKQKPW